MCNDQRTTGNARTKRSGRRDTAYRATAFKEKSSEVRKMIQRGFPPETIETLLWHIAAERRAKMRNLPIWEDAPPHVISVGGGWMERGFYNDPCRWVRIIGKHDGRLWAPIMFLMRKEVETLLKLRSVGALTGAWVFGSHMFWSVTEFDSTQDVLYELGFGANRKWSSLSPVPLGKEYMIRRRVAHRNVEDMVAKKQHDMEMRELDELCLQFTATEDELLHCRAYDIALDKKYGITRRCENCRRRRVGVCGHRVEGEVQGVFGDTLKEAFSDFAKSIAASCKETFLDPMTRRALIGWPIMVAQLWRHHHWADWALAITQYLNVVGFTTTMLDYVMTKARECYDKATLWWHVECKEAEIDRMLDSDAVDTSVLDRAKAWFARKTHKCPSGKCQGNFGDTTAEQVGIAIGTLGGLAAVVLACVGLKSIPSSDKELTGFMTRFGLIGRMISSAEMLMKFGERLGAEVTRLFRVYVLKHDPATIIPFFEMHDWCDQVAAMITTDFEANVKYNRTLHAAYDALLRKGELMHKRLSMLNVPQAERLRFTKAYDNMMRVRTTVAGSGAGCARMRQTPVIVSFVGDSGCGKSSLLWPFFADMAARWGHQTFEDATELVYFRYANDLAKHWDGYHNGIKIVVIDDIFTKKDSEGCPNPEVDEAIRMCSNTYWGLPMADLSDKGTVFFTAPLVVWTSNRDQFVFPSRTNSEAVLTRVALRYRVKPKPEYALESLVNGKPVIGLNKEKISAALQIASTNVKEFVIFEKMNPLTGETGRTMTYDEMVCEVWNTLEDSEDRFDMMQAGTKEYFDSLVKNIPAKRLADAEERHAQAAREAAAAVLEEIVDNHVDNELIEVAESIADSGVELAPAHFLQQVVRPMGEPQIDYAEAERLLGNTPAAPVVGLIQNTRVIPKPQGAVGGKNTTWLGILGGPRHYTIQNLVAAHGTSLDGVFAKEQVYNERSGKVQSLRYCIRVDRALTALEERQLVAHVVRYGMFAGSMKLHLLSFGDLLHFCETCGVEPEVLLDKTLQDLSELYLREEAEHCVFLRQEAYEYDTQKWESIMLIIKGMVSLVVAGLATYLGYKGYKKIRKMLTATDVMEEELTRSPLGEVHSRSEQSPGRTRGNVEGGARGSGHTEECKNSLDEAVRYASRRLVGSSTNASLQSRLRALEIDNEYSRWTCECGEIQGVLDQNASEVGALALQNMYKIERESEPDHWETMMNVVFVMGRIALANKHLKLAFKDPEQKMRIVNVMNPKGYVFKVKELRYMVPKRLQDQSKDLMVIEFPRRIHQHRDIVDKFVTSADFSNRSEFAAICITGHAVVSHASVLRQYFGANALAVDGFIDLVEGGDVVGEIRQYIKYKIQTVKGDCGAIVVAYDTRVNNKIIGIHAGGMDADGYTGFAQPVTRETLVDLIGEFKPRDADSKISSVSPADKPLAVVTHGHMIFPNVSLDGEFHEVGVSHSGTHRNYDTRIRKSPVHNVVQQALTAPAILRPVVVDGEKVDPMDLARQKVAMKETVLVDRSIMDRAIDNVERMVCAKAEKEDRKVVPMSVAIAGVEGDPAYPPINRKSSAGFGWNGTKRKWLGKDEYVMDNPEIVSKVTNAVEKLRRGERLNAVFVDTLKDERRTLSRVAALKTRLFSAGEMIFTLVFRMFFLGFAAHMHRRRGDVESCVGINDKSIEWHHLALALQSKGPHVVAGDFTNYDGSLCPDLLWGVHDIIQSFYEPQSPEDRMARTALWSDVVNSWHISGKVVYMWGQSNPSGCPITSLLNSVAHSIAARYVWLSLANRYAPMYASLNNFKLLVVHRNYGDDDVWNISSDVIGWFNQRTLTEGFLELGMVYTDEKKSGEVIESRRLGEVEFLKRGFLWNSEICRWVSPLQLGVILEMPMWMHDTADEFMQTAVTLQTAEQELALHPAAVYAEHIVKLNRAADIVRDVYPVEFLGRTEVLMNRRIAEMN